MPEPKYAEQMPYWQTTVQPYKTQDAIMRLFKKFGAEERIISQGQAAGRYAWMVRFQWRGKSYRFVFTPLRCKSPAKQIKGRTHEEQATYQMARIALYCIKNLFAFPDSEFLRAATFGFMEVTDGPRHPGGLPYTMAELGAEKLSGRLLGSGMEDVIDVEASDA